jgi:hypothetical protein
MPGYRPRSNVKAMDTPSERSKYWVPGDELTVLDENGNGIQRPKPETEEELRKRDPARMRSKAAIERILKRHR